MLDLNALLSAFSTAHYVVGGGILVAALVGLAKQGYLSTKLAMWLPPSFLPWLAVLLGVLTTASTEWATGLPFWTGLRDGALAGITAVFAHQTIIEGARGGKEAIPETSKKVVAESIRPPAMKPSEAVTVPELQGVVSSRPPPPNPPRAA